MSDTKLVFIDLDGTLFDRSQKPLASALDACAQLSAAGHTLFMSTGRSLPEIYPWIWDCGFSGIVGATGAYVRIEDTVIADRRIAAADMQVITEVWDRLNGLWLWQGADIMYAAEGYLETFVPQAGNAPADWLPYGDSVRAHLGHGHPRAANKCTVYLPEDSPGIAELSAMIPEGYRLYAGSVGAGNMHAVELLPEGISKGVGIELVAAHLGVSTDSCVAIGDSTNDIEALETAGYAIAMGGSSPAVQARADFVAPALSDDGFYWGMVHAGLIPYP